MSFYRRTSYFQCLPVKVNYIKQIPIGMKNLMVILICFLFAGHYGYSQNKLEFDLGLGLLERVSLKVKYGKKNQIAICQSFAKKSFWLTGIEAYYHFSFSTKYPDAELFYAMTGLSATVFTPGYSSFETKVNYYRIGKTINFSEKSGLNLDAGVGVLMGTGIDQYRSKVFPTFAIHFFMRM